MSNMTQPQSLLADCETSFKIVADPFYKASQIVTLVFSILGAASQLHFICRKLIPSSLNPNIKLLYVFYFLGSFILCFTCMITFSIHVAKSYSIENQCAVLIDPLVNRLLHHFGTFGVISPMITMVGVVTERTTALVFARFYEQRNLFYAWILVVMTTSTSIIIVVRLFRNESFENLFSAFLTPHGSGPAMNTLCLTLFFVAILVAGWQFALVKLNKRTRQRALDQPLSTRFILEENILTNKFSAFLCISHIIFFTIYLASTLVIRSLGLGFFGTEVRFNLFRGAYLSMPLYNAICPFAAWKVLNYWNRKKKEKLAKIVGLKVTGQEGIQLQEKILNAIWSTKSSRVAPAPVASRSAVYLVA